MHKIILVVKRVIIFLFFSWLPVFLIAQTIDTTAPKKDTLYPPVSDPILQTVATDTVIMIRDTTLPAAGQRRDTLSQFLLQQNTLLNSKGTPVALAVKLHQDERDDAIFYLLTGVVLLLAFLKFFFNRYFINLFRVFFNTSLRQSQLTDQLLQAKLPSLLFNIFFMISGGIFVYFLLFHYQWINGERRWLIMGICIAVMAVIYVIKYSSLKFTGWVTGYSESTNTYVFVIFLINKIIGIFLVPATIVIAFSLPSIASGAALVSLLCVGTLLLMRFFRSYSLIQNQLKISRLHFFLYILGIEILPILLIYKALIFLLNKNL